MTGYSPHSGSFRDPRGQVYVGDDWVYRTVTEIGRADYEFVRDSNLIRDLDAEGLVLGAEEVSANELGPAAEHAVHVLRHPKIPFISYPYEWTFSALKDAALLHLDLHRKALARDVTMTDATAYNVQFMGGRPVFIDHLSFCRYHDGDIWVGHKQFCDQFLNPLLLAALRGLPFNDWYRGTLEGIDATQLARLLPLRHRLSWRVFAHVVLQARFQRASLDRGDDSLARGLKGAKLPKTSLERMLESLHNWIARLSPARGGPSEWGDYTPTTSYSDLESELKQDLVRRFAETEQPPVLWDIGCNDGTFASIALSAGAGMVVGLDQDHNALEAAYARARENSINLLPLYANLANPSPDQGWAQSERQGLAARSPADAIQALAVIHHLAIGRNIPLDRLLDWLIGLAPAGIVEFVPKSDRQVQRLLLLREDLFPDYTTEAFEAQLSSRARIVEKKAISEGGRVLYWFDRR